MDVKDRLEKLRNLETRQLRAEWQELFGRPAPEKMRRDQMVPILSYRVQELAYGGLSEAMQRRLRQLAKELAANPNALMSQAPRIKPGTRIVRSWNGETHTVMVLEKKYAYKDQCYGSLSEIARVITGTRWSGPAFFGLKNRSSNGQ
jgi:hypothetical protein